MLNVIDENDYQKRYEPSSGNGGGVLAYVRIDTASSCGHGGAESSIGRVANWQISCARVIGALNAFVVPGFSPMAIISLNGMVPIVIGKSSETKGSFWS